MVSKRGGPICKKFTHKIRLSRKRGINFVLGVLTFINQTISFYKHYLIQLQKQVLDDHSEPLKKERSVKNKERKEKLTDEEKDARKERKLGRKRERLEETSSTDHKRRRDGREFFFYDKYIFIKNTYFIFVALSLVLNGDDDQQQQRERDKYHTRVRFP